MNRLTALSTSVEGFDIIGDVHGCARTLKALLERLGYQLDGEVYWHPRRKAIFVGDILDRGPRIHEAIRIVRAMVENDQAYCIVGNHEFNAVAYTTEVSDPGADPSFLRPHDKRNNRLIHETLVQFASFPDEWRATLEWFKSLPLFLESEAFRVVHACWDTASVARLRAHSGTDEPTLGALMDALVSGDKELTRALDRITRGTSLSFPDGRYLLSRDGLKRDIFRTKFWSIDPETYSDVVFQPDPLPEDLMERKLNERERRKLISYPASEVPVFFGHYWLQGRPRVQRQNLACLDYSAVKFGRLVAYRFDGESTLSNDRFVWVYVDPKPHNS